MRSRNLKVGLFKNELLGTADPLLTILFEGLWCLADRQGRLEDRPLRIKAEIFPYREGLQLDGQLDQLADMGFIQRYESDGVAVIQVINFQKHQTPHPKEAASCLPQCSREKVGPSREKILSSPSDVLNPDVLNPDSGSLPPSKEGFDFNSSARARDVDEGIHGVEKRYSQADFDARDLRKLSKARDELELKLSNGWGFNLTDDQIFEEQCARAGISVERALEVTKRAMKWPSQSVGASA